MSWFEREVPAKEGMNSLGIENVTLFPSHYYNFEMKELSGKDSGRRNNSPLLVYMYNMTNEQWQQQQTKP